MQFVTIPIYPVFVSLAIVPIPPMHVTPVTPEMRPGPARPWHAEGQVSTYTRANLFHGNLFTEIPIVSWSGGGPDMDFRLYHNSANWNQTPDSAKNVGFFLGPGWSVSYSDHILDTNPKVVVHADGTRDTYTWNGTKWVPPAGVYDELEQDSKAPDTWRLRHKDQSYHEFNDDSDGIFRLSKIVDASGNEARLIYETYSYPGGAGKLLKAVWAGGFPIDQPTSTQRKIFFEYTVTESYPYRRLIRIDDPGETNLPEAGVSSPDRSWHFSYDDFAGPPAGLGWMISVRDPMGFYNNFTYRTATIGGVLTFVGRLATVSDKTESEGGGHQYVHQYNNALPFRVIDPVGALYQQFTFSYASQVYTTTFRDRRGNNWTYKYNDLVEENLFPDGNLNRITDPTGVNYFFYHDSQRNTDLIYDNGGNSWYRIFDTRGNLVWSEDPLGHFRYFTYDSLNNLTAAYDQLSIKTLYCYEKEGHPTLVT